MEENQPALLRDGACGVVAATAMNRHCDTVMRTAGPRYRASGNRTQRLQGGEVLIDQDVATKTMGIIVVVSPLWFNDSRSIAAAQICAKSAFGLGTNQGLDDFQRKFLVLGR